MAKGMFPMACCLIEDIIANLQTRFVEFETAPDLKKAVEALDGREFKEHRVTCTPNVGSPTLFLFFVFLWRLIEY